MQLILLTEGVYRTLIQLAACFQRYGILIQFLLAPMSFKQSIVTICINYHINAERQLNINQI